MLDVVLKNQLRSYFKDLDSEYTFDISVSRIHKKREELIEILNDVADCSPRISCRVNDGKNLEFTLLKDGENTRIKFRSTPNGHEFSSLILAILNCDGKGKNLPTPGDVERIRALKGPIRLVTYVSLNCLICSETVEMLNMFTTINKEISHEIVDGSINKLEIIDKFIQGLPTIYANNEILHIGRSTYTELTNKLESRYKSN